MFILRTSGNITKVNWWGRGLPTCQFDEVKERIGLNDEYEEYAIHDYELPFEIDEYTPIEEINRLCGLAEELEERQLVKLLLRFNMLSSILLRRW